MPRTRRLVFYLLPALSSGASILQNLVPSLNPPTNINYTDFTPPSPSDARSPCPMLNALSNHGILPHNGRLLTLDIAVNALVNGINLDRGVATVLAGGALHANPSSSPAPLTFDLDHLNRHDVIEHDVSISRNDAALGDNHDFDARVWSGTLAVYGGANRTSFALASKARYARVLACRDAHAAAGVSLGYGPKELVLSYGETALALGLLGDPENGEIPVEFLRVLVEQERLPYIEGWRKSPRPITQVDINHMVLSLFLANDERLAEAELVALDTVQAVNDTITSLIPTLY